ncbi:hypothetical protein PoB_003353500 [Plakobranchus ocellatus]|uniref:Uncharacterized protein n=1 Tax=Plakobranchus ocellatus TaxID=259542 RepID=A0AAV4AFU1_9GAST|nr:hypothetical protein PoB_003353500 [Plakobranchus ocellatus]
MGLLAMATRIARSNLRVIADWSRWLERTVQFTLQSVGETSAATLALIGSQCRRSSSSDTTTTTPAGFATAKKTPQPSTQPPPSQRLQHSRSIAYGTAGGRGEMASVGRRKSEE